MIRLFLQGTVAIVAAFLSGPGLAAPAAAASAADAGSGRAAAERMLQVYLAMWSDDSRVTAGTVDRFYAPKVRYYGHPMSRAAVLADKRAFVRAYPQRSYREVPGTFAGRCDVGRSLCRVTAEVEYRRVDRRGTVTAGRAELGFDFVPAEGGRKIAAESAVLLPPRGS